MDCLQLAVLIGLFCFQDPEETIWKVFHPKRVEKIRWRVWMLEGAGVAREAPPQGTGPDAGPRISFPHTDIHPRSKGGVKHALHRRRTTLVP